jgi:drug/metabolite transporter (DMT)-like permease
MRPIHDERRRSAVTSQPSGGPPTTHIDAAIVAVIASAILFGASTPLARALAVSLDPLWLAGALYAGSGIGLSLWLLLRPRNAQRGSPLIAARDLGWVAAAIGCGGILAPVAFAFGLRATSGAAASLLLNLETVFTVVLAWFLFGEHRSAQVVAGMALIVAASAMLAWQGAPGEASGRGAGLLALACLLWALDNNLTRKVAANDAVALAAAKGVAGGTVNVGLALWLTNAVPAIHTIAAAAAVGLVGYGVSLVLFIVAMRGLGVARASAYYALAPFVGVAVAFAALGERPSPWFWPALALMLGGVWLHLTERHAHRHRHAALAHSHPHTHDAHHAHTHDFPWDGVEPHVHPHEHAPVTHAHVHFPDLHHRHPH